MLKGRMWEEKCFTMNRLRNPLEEIKFPTNDISKLKLVSISCRGLLEFFSFGDDFPRRVDILWEIFHFLVSPSHIIILEKLIKITLTSQIHWVGQEKRPR